MPRPLYVTGTGTDIGKTHVLCALLKAASEQDRPRVLKPVLSGFDRNAVAASDTARLLRANGQTVDTESFRQATPWLFSAPLSPDMAARRENRRLPLQSIVDWCFDQCSGPQPAVIEGAGGLMSPIAEDGLNLDLLRELDAKPVLIAGAYLGALSHTLTALRALDGHCTVVVNPFGDLPVPVEEHVRTLSRYAPRASIHVFGSDDGLSLAGLFGD